MNNFRDGQSHKCCTIRYKAPRPSKVYVYYLNQKTGLVRRRIGTFSNLRLGFCLFHDMEGQNKEWTLKVTPNRTVYSIVKLLNLEYSFLSIGICWILDETVIN